MALASQGGFPSGDLDGGSSLLQVLSPITSPATCVAGTYEFPSYSLGSVKTQALQEMNKKLGRGVLEVAENRRAEYYSWLFLAQTAPGGWKPVIGLSSPSNDVTFMEFRMETVSLVLGLIRKGDVMFLIDLKDTWFHISIHQDSQPHLQ